MTPLPVCWSAPRVAGSGVGCLVAIALSIAPGCTASDTQDFTEAQRAGTVEALEGFIAKHPDSRLMPAAMERLDDALFDAAREAKTMDAWKVYLEKHPNGSKAPQARYELEQLAYNAAAKAGSAEAFQAFLQEYPNGTFTAAARKKLETLQAQADGAMQPSGQAVGEQAGVQ